MASSADAAGTKKCIVLWATMTADPGVQDKTTKIQHWLKAYKVKYDMVDGCDPELKATRNSLFEVSGLRGKYPQVFLQEGDTTTFVGDFDAINELVESNKDLGTFDQAFAGVEKDE